MSGDNAVKGKCYVCSYINSDSTIKVYENKEVVAFLNPTPAVPGEVLITTKNHYAVLEQVPNFVVGEMFSLANRISKALFQILELDGTNILVNNGPAAGQQVHHVLVHVIPRKKGDNLNFDWEKKKASDEDLKTAMLKLKAVTDKIVVVEDSNKVEASKTINNQELLVQKSQKSEGSEKDEKHNHQVKESNKESKSDKNIFVDHKNYKEKEIHENYLLRHLRRMP